MKYTKKRIINKAIPDNDPNGLVDRIIVSRNLTVKNVGVHVEIEHPYNGDISLELTSPTGKKSTILSPSKVPGKNLNKTISGTTTEGFNGIKSRGEWVLKVIDAGAKDSGKLISWTLDLKLARSKTSEIFIDDNENLKSVQVCHQGGKISSMTGHITIEHSHVGDIVCLLTGPSGKKVKLLNKTGGSQKNLSKSFSADDLKEFNGETAKGKWQLDVSDTMNGDSGKLLKWGLNFKTSTGAKSVSKKSGKKDDLTKIEGVGPKIMEILHKGGITSYQELAHADAGVIKKMLEAGGPRFKMHDPGSWPKQAKLAASGNWDELKKLQDELDGGK